MRQPAAVEPPEVRFQRLKLPPLWLAASAMTGAITVAFGVARWIDHFVSDPNAQDFRVWQVAARIGLTHGWSHIYDLDLERQASADLGPVGSLIDSMHLYLSPPPAAWIIVPMAWFPTSTAYVVWALINLCAFVAACWLVVPGSRLVRVTVVLVSLALWPVHYQFWLGQWVVADLALLAATWWLLERDRVVLAGVVLAIPFFFKPQDVLLVPVALLVSGRWRPVAVFAITAAGLAALSAASLGPAGIAAWLNDLGLARADPHTGPMTYSFIFGRTSLAAAVEIGLGLGALALAWYRRDRLDLVFALGLVGTTASATYLHEDDMAMLVLGAWIVLRSQPSVTQRVWLLAGIAAAQFIAVGIPIPMLVWEPVWIALLGLEPRLKRLEIPARTQPQAALSGGRG
jgi:Glycosyltransferase family 87